MSLFRGVWFFFKFFKFCLFSLSFFGGKWVCGTEAQEHNTRVDQNQNPSFRASTIDRAVLLGIFLLFFWGHLRTIKKKNISKRLSTLSGERARQKRAVVRRDDENDDDRKGVSVRLVFFFVATKEEDEEGGTIERFVTFVYGFVQRHSSLSFFLSLSLWNDGTDFCCLSSSYSLSLSSGGLEKYSQHHRPRGE